MFVLQEIRSNNIKYSEHSMHCEIMSFHSSKLTKKIDIEF